MSTITIDKELKHTRMLLELASDRVNRADLLELNRALGEYNRLTKRIQEIEKAPQGS